MANLKKKLAKRKKKKKNGLNKGGHFAVAVSDVEQWCASSIQGSSACVELHSHSNFSDGLLTPEQLVDRAFKHGVKVLALTDHDTMAGVPRALVAARKYGMRLIPGVEISSRYRNSAGKMGEIVHILAYYGSCGPAEQLEKELFQIREGRFTRAQSMVRKLNEMKKPLKWESVLREAGPGVAPGRPHIARALVKAGLVSDEGEAFRKYIGDDGPAYANGTELAAEEAVELVLRTGGIATLAHPWSLKNPLDVVKKLKQAGLHAMEAYKADGKDSAFASLADAYQLVKLGGSDFHGTGASHERELGSVQLPVKAIHEFLKLGEPAWTLATKQILSSLLRGTLRDAVTAAGQQDVTSVKEFLYGDVEIVHSDEATGAVKALKLSAWMNDEEMAAVASEAADLGMEHRVETKDSVRSLIVTTK